MTFIASLLRANRGQDRPAKARHDNDSLARCCGQDCPPRSDAGLSTGDQPSGGDELVAQPATYIAADGSWIESTDNLRVLPMPDWRTPILAKRSGPSRRLLGRRPFGRSRRWQDVSTETVGVLSADPSALADQVRKIAAMRGADTVIVSEARGRTWTDLTNGSPQDVVQTYCYAAFVG